MEQGLNAVMEVFIVSFVTSSVSALTILVSGVWQSGLNSTALVAAAFDTAIPGGGYLVALVALAGVREKLKYADIPQGLQGLGITFIATGLMALAFMSFSGVQL